jgi:hypothetical protein
MNHPRDMHSPAAAFSDGAVSCDVSASLFVSFFSSWRVKNRCILAKFLRMSSALTPDAGG